MGMLKSICLENYKCFKNNINIDISPLTILCGVNSSGKSSILKSLLMLKQTAESNSSLNTISLNGEYTNNGWFKDVVYGGKGSLFSIGHSFDIRSNSYNTTQEKNTLKEINYIFKCSNKAITSARLDSKFYVKNQNRKILSYGDNIIEKIEINLTTNLNHNLFIQFLHIQEKKYNVLIKGLPSIKREQIELIDTVCHFEGLKVVNMFFDHVEPLQDVTEILASVYSIFRILSMQYNDVYYISPLRNAPQRRYIIEKDIENIGIYGEYVPQILEKYKEINGRINDIPVEDRVSSRYIPIKLKTKEAVNKWMNYLGIDNLTLDGFDELLKLSVGDSNILDVGFGISQALPIVVNGVVLPYETTLLLEQPEVHLHPSMQMRMADLLLAISMAHKNIIVETHSDHIINRIVRRVIEDDTGILQKHVKILFVDRKSDEIITSIPIIPTKGIVDAPTEFFSQFADETQRIIVRAIKNRKY